MKADFLECPTMTALMDLKVGRWIKDERLLMINMEEIWEKVLVSVLYTIFSVSLIFSHFTSNLYKCRGKNEIRSSALGNKFLNILKLPGRVHSCQESGAVRVVATIKSSCVYIPRRYVFYWLAEYILYSLDFSSSWECNNLQNCRLTNESGWP